MPAPGRVEPATAANGLEDALHAAVLDRLAGVDLSGRGSGFERDTYCLALEETTRILGRRANCRTLLALTGGALAPGL